MSYGASMNKIVLEEMNNNEAKKSLTEESEKKSYIIIYNEGHFWEPFSTKRWLCFFFNFLCPLNCPAVTHQSIARDTFCIDDLDLKRRRWKKNINFISEIAKNRWSDYSNSTSMGKKVKWKISLMDWEGSFNERKRMANEQSKSTLSNACECYTNIL